MTLRLNCDINFPVGFKPEKSGIRP